MNTSRPKANLSKECSDSCREKIPQNNNTATATATATANEKHIKYKYLHLQN